MANLIRERDALQDSEGDSALSVSEDSGMSVVQELKLLREENVNLHEKIDELEQLLTMAIQDSEDRLNERQGEYERLLEEKSEVIRGLHLKNTELREQTAAASIGAADASGQLPERAELLRLKAEVEEGRQQLHEDEESMMGQLRQMEMALAKDRAELARQRAELERLQNELKHELEVAARDGGLRERLGAIRRRANTAPASYSSASQDTPLPTQLPLPAINIPEKPTKSGLFRRIFG